MLAGTKDLTEQFIQSYRYEYLNADLSNTIGEAMVHPTGTIGDKSNKL